MSVCPSAKSAKSSKKRKNGRRTVIPSSCSSTRWMRSSEREAPEFPPISNRRSSRCSGGQGYFLEVSEHRPAVFRGRFETPWRRRQGLSRTDDRCHGRGDVCFLGGE